MKISKLFVLVLVFALSVFLVNCGGSKKMAASDTGAENTAQKGADDDYDEIEKLLGISNTKTAEDESKAAGDDLISLLETDEGKNTQPRQEAIQTQPAPQKPADADKLEKLRKEMKKKEMEIAELKAQLMLKDEELKRLKQGNSGLASFSSEKSISRISSTRGNGYKASPDYIAKYEEGLALFRNRQYRDALKVFEQLIAQDVENDYSDNAQYWIGECLFALGRYQDAIIAFEKVFTYRFSNKNDYAQFKIGQCYFKLGDKQRARLEFQQFLDNYPKSELIGRAEEYLAQL
ncbi:MAG: hypothetical protein Kow0037_07380 [Calditrichia bacterium]